MAPQPHEKRETSVLWQKIGRCQLEHADGSKQETGRARQVSARWPTEQRRVATDVESDGSAPRKAATRGGSECMGVQAMSQI